jgi:hypothetical protein
MLPSPPQKMGGNIAIESLPRRGAADSLFAANRELKQLIETIDSLRLRGIGFGA